MNNLLIRVSDHSAKTALCKTVSNTYFSMISMKYINNLETITEKCRAILLDNVSYCLSLNLYSIQRNLLLFVQE